MSEWEREKERANIFAGYLINCATIVVIIFNEADESKAITKWTIVIFFFIIFFCIIFHFHKNASTGTLAFFTQAHHLQSINKNIKDQFKGQRSSIFFVNVKFVKETCWSTLSLFFVTIIVFFKNKFYPISMILKMKQKRGLQNVR